jgi:hypothetical protein
MSGRRWTGRDLDMLRNNWGDVTPRELARLLGRSEFAVFLRAVKLGLRAGCPPGFEYLTEAARRTGYDDTSPLRSVLRWAGVKIRRSFARPNAKAHNRPRHIVDSYDVDVAIARWHTTETTTAAARRYDTDCMTLRRLLRRAVAAGVEMPREPKGYNQHWRVPSDIIDRVVAEHRQTETLNQASRRVGVHHNTLTSWLRAAGVELPRVKPWRLSIATVDAVVAERVAMGRRAKPAIGRAA